MHYHFLIREVREKYNRRCGFREEYFFDNICYDLMDQTSIAGVLNILQNAVRAPDGLPELYMLIPLLDVQNVDEEMRDVTYPLLFASMCLLVRARGLRVLPSPFFCQKPSPYRIVPGDDVIDGEECLYQFKAACLFYRAGGIFSAKNVADDPEKTVPCATYRDSVVFRDTDSVFETQTQIQAYEDEFCQLVTRFTNVYLRRFL